MVNKYKIKEFQEFIWSFYTRNKRSMPWREDTSLYSVLVSEIMLQQTQVTRVIPKFEMFTKTLKNFKDVAKVDTKTLLSLWSGLGYNNRALRLRELAKKIVPNKAYTLEDLDELPGIGKATAGAIMAYAYNKPEVFIETNIRRVFIHHFFSNSTNISDTELLPYIEASLDPDNPREWYWALMDYGSFLKKTIPNPNRKSKSYSIQSKFEGSVRQVRGEILRRLQIQKVVTLSILEEFGTQGQLAMNGLKRDKIIEESNTHIKLV